MERKGLFGSRQATGLRELFLAELKDIYWAEQALTKALPKMLENASSEELYTAIDEHIVETKNHVTRLEEVFAMLEEEPEAEKCEAMQGLITEAEEMMDETERGPLRDAAIISCAQKVEHYEIASYGTLVAFANTMKEKEVSEVLAQTLTEEKEADDTLSNIAESVVNLEAAEREESEE
jgi:ferritin-like metal-binding protein YciE